jgi:hypothetical protein
MLTLTDGIRLRRLPRLTIRTKTLAASAFALLCLIGMGVIVQLTTSRVARDLSELSQSNFPIRAAASALNDNILAVHMRVFRYVSWAGNGVSHPLMENLSSEIAIDFGLIQEEFDELATRADLTAAEKAELAALQTKIKEYERTTRDVLEVGRTDAAMATMMLGQTDDKYVGVEEDIRKILAVIAADSTSIVRNLVTATKTEALSLAIGLIICLSYSASRQSPLSPDRSSSRSR